MTQETNRQFPESYVDIDEATQKCGFTMASDIRTGSLLRTLAASKPSGKFLELGTGTGLSTSWILDGMDGGSSLISIDNDRKFLEVAEKFLGTDARLSLIVTDGEEWIKNNKQLSFDYIFADTWHGKYLLLDEVLSMMNKGALYIIDDMLPQPNWPEGHYEKSVKLIESLESRPDLQITTLAWSTGILIAVKK